MLSKEEIENKLEQTEDDEITINLLYQEVDLLETKIEQLESNNKKLIEKLEDNNKTDTEKVKYYEKQYKHCTDEFYKKSYKRTIDMTNAKRETRKSILEILKGEKE